MSVRNISSNRSNWVMEGSPVLVSGTVGLFIVLILCLEAVKIGWRDPSSPNSEFIEFFVQAEPSRLHEADTNPEKFSFVVGPKLRLMLYVDLVSFILIFGCHSELTINEVNRQPTSSPEHNMPSIAGPTNQPVLLVTGTHVHIC